jgi:hypothetical protein
MHKFLVPAGGPPAPKRTRTEEEAPPSAPERARTEQTPPPPTLTTPSLATFYERKTGPTFAKACPPNPYNEFGKVTMKVTRGKTTRVVTFVQVRRSGTVVGDCTNCTSTFCPIAEFRPPECNRNGRRAPEFDAAVARLEEAVREEDAEKGKIAVEEVAEARNAHCVSCQEVDSKLSPAQQACKDFWVRTRREACERQDGCANASCPARGPDAELVLQYDHDHGVRDEDVERRKTHKLSAYCWWACNGGVKAMRKELAKGGQFICACCHALDESSASSRRIADPALVETLPDGKSNGTKEEVAQYNRKWKARITAPKYAHVDALKRKRGKCYYCERKVEQGEEVCFEHDHDDPTTKWFSKTNKGCSGGVCGLCASTKDEENPRKSPGVYKRLDAETDHCRLTCCNCHTLRTHHPDSEAWAKLAAASEARLEEGGGSSDLVQ